MPDGSAPETLDKTGKSDFNAIYSAPDPRKYFNTLRRHGYVIPESAYQVFSSIYKAYRKQRGAHRLRVIDVGCSYGINAALQKYGLSLSELEARYAAFAAEGLSSDEVLERDRNWFASRPVINDLVFTGLDSAAPAIDYAVRTGLLDCGLSTNLEAGEPLPQGWSGLGGADLVISTGAIGYVTEKTFQTLADAAQARPWIASFCLRQFDITPIARAMTSRGYVAEKLEGRVFPQRRFTGPKERDGALGRLAEIGRDATALEESGWYAAEFYLLRPKEEAESAPLDGLVDTATLPAAKL
ncbi:MAG: class I SAM-dependent methyltransferase [Oceanicaulis sp.]